MGFFSLNFEGTLCFMLEFFKELFSSNFLPQLLPKALALPSRTQLEAANRELQKHISEREQAEVELHQSEERYRWLVELSPDTIVVHSKGKFLFINRAGIELFGATSAEQFIGKSIYDFVHPDYFEIVKTRQQQTQEERKPAELSELKFVKVDGQVIDVEAVATPIIYLGEAATQAVIRDITERKQAEQTLQESEMRFRSLTQSATDAIISADSIGNITFWNKGAQTIFGYAEEEVLGQPLSLLMPERYIEAHQTAIKRMSSTGESHVIGKTVELHGLRQDGLEFPLELSLSSWQTAEGRFYTGIIRDTAKRKRTEEALTRRAAELEESRGFLNSIIENIPNMLFVKDVQDLKFIQWNKAAEELLGLAWKDVIGKNDYDFFPKEQADFFTAKDREVLAGSKLVDIPEESIHTNKGTRLLHTRKVPIFGADGQVKYLLGITEDITERKRAAEALEQRAAQLALINDIGGKIAAVLELDSVLDRAAQLVQHTFGYYHVALFLLDKGVARLKAIAGSYNTYFPPNHSQSLQQGIIGWVATHGDKVIANDVSLEPRYISLIADRTETRAELCLPIEVAGQTVGVLDIQSLRLNAFSENDVIAMETLTDQIAVAIENARLYEAVQQELMERRQAEAALEAERTLLARRVEERTADLSAANAELARAARLKDEFLANMSHELRTPLNAIMGLSEALQEQVYGVLNEKQLKTLHTIGESGRHLLLLINDILDLSKIEAGKLELEIGEVSIEVVCQASLRFVKQASHDKRLGVSSTLDSKVTTIQADERRLKQILVNLLSNAVKFTPEGGAIGLEVVGDLEQQAIHFTVWDTGRGISSEDMKQLFQPFVQLDSKLSRQYSGTGLGLSLVYRMVELHGGSVSLESEVAQGSRFTVSLPWREPAQTTEPAWKAQLAGLATSNISAIRQALIIEDSPTAADQLTRYLTELNVKAIIHPRGNGAVERALEVQPDVIILDIRLPDLPGWDVLVQLKAEPRTQAIPVLIVSVVDDRQSGLRLGAAEYLVKPISRSQLQQALSKISSQEIIEEETALVVTLDQKSQTERPLILLAEDNQDNITTFLDYLLVRGYRVVVARNGAEAIERAKEEKPDLILMDIQMPGMDGLEATRRLRANADVAMTPIIALTALTMPGDRERCLAAGVNSYMSKPVSLKGLVEAIEAQLNRNRNGMRQI